MSVNVVERLIIQMMKATKLYDEDRLVDRWADGTRIKTLIDTVDKSFVENKDEKVLPKRERIVAELKGASASRTLIIDSGAS